MARRDSQVHRAATAYLPGARVMEPKRDYDLQVDIDWDDFSKRLPTGTDPSSVAARRHLFYTVFDANANGQIDYEEFLAGVQGEMSPQRYALVLLTLWGLFSAIMALTSFASSSSVTKPSSSSSSPSLTVASERTCFFPISFLWVSNRWKSSST